ncbi:response regulator [Trinickia caryophylli]|uniref:Two component transcriptional regulator, winged helix family n=1 Tax=Trinickia caryophylli TaxID=28094 RepID=A0A1X7GYQ6_TRICW|nr:response regulator [Trinickia caryophylli]PMS10178.1 two-component system response regulator OmpR [Trinickia caryophylli]TRX18206.1 response regulator [Trinickia caryophylli]WQE11006.1 response regulator [Trinickia caryophylli]SMF76858.1 two component transcriptional regulator, winged helix family [Trinickia caryophylli]
MATQILVVDDDAELRDLLRDYLVRQGIEVSVLHDAATLERRIERERPDLIVLDLMMPGVDGLTALRKLRAAGDDIPVIMLTARADDVDRIVGLELGADDYLGKPFNPRELLARVQAVLRRRRTVPSAAPEQREPFAFGRFVLDFQTRTLQMDGRPVTLSGSEFALLKILINNPMRTLTRERLLELLHGPEYDGTDRGIDVQVWRLRRILESDPSTPRFVQTVRGRGYVFVPNGEPNAPAG